MVCALKEHLLLLFFFFSEVQMVQIVGYVHVKENTMQSCISIMLIFKLIEFFPEYPDFYRGNDTHRRVMVLESAK